MLIFFVASNFPLHGQTPADNDFGQYLVAHEKELGPFFDKNTADLVKQAVPLLLGLIGWVAGVTMLIGWGLDIFLGKGYAFFFAPAYATWKKAFVYATGCFFLGFLYTCLLGIAIVFSLNLSQAGIVILVAFTVLALIAFAAQIVWILYVYRTNFILAALFYLVVGLAHFFVGVLLTKPVIGLRLKDVTTNFVDKTVTPKITAETASTKKELEAVNSTLYETKSKVSDLQDQIAKGKTEADLIRKEIDEKKNSDVYAFGQIVKVRAYGDLDSARDQLAAFIARVPSGPLNTAAQEQLNEINQTKAAVLVEKKHEEDDSARAVAKARADLLARAAKGEATLSEIRQALIGKSRTEVSALLGLPSETASDSWGYHQQMVLNPLTNEKFGLMVYFEEGTVQSVDYGRFGGAAP